MSHMLDEQTSKIRVKLGTIEVDFEGSENYIKQNLPELLKLACDNMPLFAETELDLEEKVEDEENNKFIKNPIQMTTNNIAAKLNVKNGNKLILAACAHLCFVKGANVFNRKSILSEMQKAQNYYKKSYGSNLSSYLNSLIKDEKLIERSKDSYALSAEIKQQLENDLVK